MDTSPRRFHALLEPIATTVYFAPEAASAFGAFGLDPTAAYVTSRAAAMGRVSPSTVAAVFYSFDFDMIRESLRWDLVSPEDAIATRSSVASAALGRLLDPSGDFDIARATHVLGRIAASAKTAGRALSAAHAALARPEEENAALWLAATVLREHRGDGHVAVLLAHGISPAEAILLDAAYNKMKPEKYFSFRSFPVEETSAARASLQNRGYIDAAGEFTDGGGKFRHMIEMETDRLAAAPYGELDATELEELAGLLTPIAARICDRRGVPRFVAALGGFVR